MNNDELDKLFGISPDEETEVKEEENTSAEDTSVSEDEVAESSEEEEAEEESAEIIEAEEDTSDDDDEDEEEDEEDEDEEEEPKSLEDKWNDLLDNFAPSKEEKKPRKVAPRKEENKSHWADEVPDFPIDPRIMIAISVTAILVVLVLAVALMPAFRVRNVQVDGNIVLTDDEILEQAGLKYNSHLMSGVSGNIFDILSLNYGKTEKKIMAENPYVAKIKISISIPSTVKITVEERSKVSYVRTPDGYAALDNNGLVLELRSSMEDTGSVRPVICGLDVYKAVLGEKIVLGDDSDYKKAIIVLGAILAADSNSESEYSMFASTLEVRVVPSGYIFLTIETPSHATLQVKLDGIESISDDMTWLLYAIDVNAFDGLPSGALDMTGEEYIYREY